MRMMRMTLTVLALIPAISLIVPAQTLNFTLASSKKLTTGSRVDFVAPTGHHFNSEAPNKVQVKAGDTWKTADKVEIKGTQLSAIWAKDQDFCKGMSATLYLCNDQNTYCMPVRESYDCAKGQLVPQDQASDVAQQPVSSLDKKEDSLFIMNDPQKALSEAKSQHKPLLIEFFAIWCPPCNQLNEAVFSSKEFQKWASKFVLLKLDADAPSSWSLKSKYVITGYPTVILANEDGDETNRIIGFREKSYFVDVMKRTANGKDQAFEQKKKLADEKNSAKAAYEVGLVYLDREDYASANYYLYKASRSWSLADIKRNKLLSSILGLHSHADTPEGKRTYARFLESALEWYPRQVEVFDRASDLVKVAQDLGDKDLEAKGHDVLISTAQWYLKHPKAMKQTDYSRGDLYELLGDTYEDMNDADKSKEAYSQAAAEYLRDITKAKLNPDTERGYNLERVYCLWKSGQVDEAERLYSNLEKLYPSEFTFFYQHGYLLNKSKDFKKAEGKALKALEYSYGDNKLRATGLLAEIYQNEGEKKKALKVLDQTLNHFDLPGDKSIRTHRYYDKLVAQKKKISQS